MESSIIQVLYINLRLSCFLFFAVGIYSRTFILLATMPNKQCGCQRPPQTKTLPRFSLYPTASHSNCHRVPPAHGKSAEFLGPTGAEYGRHTRDSRDKCCLLSSHPTDNFFKKKLLFFKLPSSQLQAPNVGETKMSGASRPQ